MSHFWIWKTDKGLHKGQMSKTKECCSPKAHSLSSFGSIHMERNINHRNHRCCSSAAFICYQQSLGNSRVFLDVLFLLFWFFCCFSCLCPRLLTWHSSLKFHFKKEEGQERWKFSSPSSWLGGGGGGKECGGSCCGPRAWSGQGFQMWRALAPVGFAAEPVGDRRNILARGKETMGENYGQQKPQAAHELPLFICHHHWVKQYIDTSWQCWGRCIS